MRVEEGSTDIIFLREKQDSLIYAEHRIFELINPEEIKKRMLNFKKFYILTLRGIRSLNIECGGFIDFYERTTKKIISRGKIAKMKVY